WQSQSQSLANDAWQQIKGQDYDAWIALKIEGPGLIEEERPRSFTAQLYKEDSSLSTRCVVLA
ncbi:hypothetical protein Tco_0055099, partial [Tanacetum coccineum]